MTSIKKLLIALTLVAAPAFLLAQESGGLDPATLLKPLSDSWPTYSGDYTGRRYSALTQINQDTVKSLGLSWTTRGLTQGTGPTGRGAAGGAGFGSGGGRGGGAAPAPMIVAGEGSGEFNAGGPAQVRGTIFCSVTASEIVRWQR